MQIKKIVSKNAPEPVGPYSQAVRAGNLIFVSGQIGVDAMAGGIVKGGIQAETEAILNGIKEILFATGTGMEKIVKVDVFLRNQGDFQQFNEAYQKFFSKEPLPARTAIGVSWLPKGALVEISCIATAGKKASEKVK